MTVLQGALESGAPLSRLHERQSYDPADFPVPTGREEEWRFTPLRRLRGLQGDTVLPECKVTVKPIPHPRSHAGRRGGSRRLNRRGVPGR